MDKVLSSLGRRLISLILYVLWIEDQFQLHIILKYMAIVRERKKAIQYILHSCVKRFIDNTTVVYYIIELLGIYSPNLCIEVWESLFDTGNV